MMKLTRSEIEKCVRYVHAALVQDGKIQLSEDVVELLTEGYHDQSTVSMPLKPQEHGIVTLTRPKSTALFADRVWSVGNPPEDPAITFGWEVPRDVRWRALLDLGVLQAESDGSLHEIENAPREATLDFMAYLGDLSRDMATDYRLRGANVAPLYGSTEARDAEYRSGDQGVVVAIADGVMVVNEDALVWDQVKEFRLDSTARTTYRRFIHWLDKEMSGKPAAFVADEIATRLERYEWALRKHGVETVTGALERTINPDMIAGASVVGATLQLLMNQPVWALLASGGLVLGGAALSLSRVALARKDIAMNHREIAYVHQVKTRF